MPWSDRPKHHIMKAELVLLCVLSAHSSGWRSISSSKSPADVGSRPDRTWPSEAGGKKGLFPKKKFNANYQVEKSMFSQSHEMNSVVSQNTEARALSSVSLNISSEDGLEFTAQSNEPYAHNMESESARKLLLEKLHDFALTLLELGLIGPCSHAQSKKFESLVVEMVELSLFNRKMIEDTFISKMQSLVRNLLFHQINQTKPDRDCQRSKTGIWNQLNAIASYMDDGLVFFLNKELQLMHTILHPVTVVTQNMTSFARLADHICRNWASRERAGNISCVGKFRTLGEKRSIFPNNFNEFEASSKRTKRSFDIHSSNFSIFDRRNGYGYGRDSYGGKGYGGYGHEYGKEYKDHSSNVIVIPVHDNTDDYDKKLIKLIGALAIGTYGILGVLVLKTLLHSFFSRGRIGPSGDKGPSGIKGMKGLNGMGGDKGMKGKQGPKGTGGPTGNKGQDGAQVNGSAGPPGPSGKAGEVQPGMGGDKGDPGMQGDPGEKGQTGDAGEAGERGDPGRGNSGNTAAGLSRREQWQGNNPRTTIGSQLQLFKNIPRKKRDLSKHSLESVADAPALLKELYAQQREKVAPSRTAEAKETVKRLNHLWRSYRNPFACGKCSLFDFLQDEHTDRLDAYILAGFAHALGDTDSPRLLEGVRQARKAGVALRCRPYKTSCVLQTSSALPHSGSRALLWTDVY